jgi:hypothetical protein
MKTITTTAIVALMTATIGLSAIVPTFAQTAAPAQAQAQSGPGLGFRNHDMGGPRGGRGGDMLNVERGVEAVEIALVRLSHSLELTAEQQPLFDALKTAALSAATDFDAATEGLRPVAPAAGGTAAVPDMAERLGHRIAMQTAHLAALEAVQPAAIAFFDSLTDEQNAQLTPQRPDRGGMPGFGKGGPRHDQQHRQGGPAAPGAGPAVNR